MKIVLALATLALSATAQAETFKCSFTEPFFSLTYSTSSKKLIREDAGDNKKSVVRDVSFVIVGDNKFELRSAKNKVLATLILDHKGSDGMSDIDYPFSMELPGGDIYANGGFGGCESTLLKGKNSQL